MLGMAVNSQAQKMMSPPHVMILPSVGYCENYGYMRQDNGESTPDYEMALRKDENLHNVLTQIAELISDRNGDIVLIDLMQAIQNMKNDADMHTANDGDLSESQEEAIIRNSEADILIRVQYSKIVNGPQKRIQYTITATDAYTSRMFAPVEGMGEPSTAANDAVLVREAIYNKMDNFLDKIMAYYSGMIKNGRMVAFDIKTTSSSPYTMDSKIGEYTLRENIEDFIFDNSVEGNGTERVKGGATFLQYQGVYIPLVTTIRGRQRKQGAKDVAQKLVRYLEEKGVTAEFKIVGLGKINMFIK